MDFNTLYTGLSPALKRIARGYQGRSLYIDADDLYQEMCFYLWSRYKQGMPAHINKAYIINGCKFHILNYLRKHRAKGVVLSLEAPLNEEGLTIKDTLSIEDEPLQRCLDRKLTFEEIRNNGFTRREKEVLGHLIKGLTVREVGQKLGISHVMVLKYKKRLISRWRKKKGYQNR